MSKESASIAAPITLELDEKTYVLTPPNMRSLKQLEKYAQDQIIESVKPSLDGLPFEYGKVILESAIGRRTKCKIGTKVFDEEVMTPTNIPFVLWLLLQPKYPAMTLAETEDMFKVDNTAKIMRAIFAMMGQEVADPLASSTQQPTTT